MTLPETNEETNIRHDEGITSLKRTSEWTQIIGVIVTVVLVMVMAGGWVYLQTSMNSVTIKLVDDRTKDLPERVQSLEGGKSDIATIKAQIQTISNDISTMKDTQARTSQEIQDFLAKK